MALTAKQEIFIDAKADGLSHVDAYKRAYNTSKMAAHTIENNAYMLTKHNEVAARIEERQKAIIDEVVRNKAWDLSDLLERYQENAIGAAEDHQWAASNGALTGYGKASGLVTDKLDVNVTHTLKPGLSLEELEDRMGRLNALEAGIVEGEGEIVE